MSSNFNNLNKSIINCEKCKRLVKFRQKISKEKRKQYIMIGTIIFMILTILYLLKKS